MIRSAFHTAKIDYSKKIVWIVDNDAGGMSVTNDADRITQYMNDQHPEFRIFYRDTEYKWSELCHKNGTFLGYRTQLSKHELISCPEIH